jgi:hypothetical protein
MATAPGSGRAWALSTVCLWACSDVGSQDEALTVRATTSNPVAVIQGQESALIGGTDFDDETVSEDGLSVPGCSPDDKAMFRQIMTLGRTVALGGAIRDCIRLVMLQGYDVFGPYHPCGSDPFARDAPERRVEGVLDVVTTPNPLRITCTTGNIGITRVGGRYELASGVHEAFEIPNPPLAQLFDAKYLSGSSSGSRSQEETDFRARALLLAPRSALVWHEAMHVREYRHDCPNQTYFQSVPYMVQFCLQEVAQESLDRCDVRGGCSTGGERALIDSFPATDKTGCECVRDAMGEHGPELPATPRLDRAEGGDLFGAALAAGDFDGDGFADLVVGAPGEDAGRGRLFLYLGSTFGLGAAQVLDQGAFDPEEPGDEFGQTLLAADLDRDQIDDLIVGAPGEDGDRGAVYLFRGTRGGLSPHSALRPQEKLPQVVAGDRLGASLAAGPFLDLTRPVLAVGAPGKRSGRRPGAVYLFGGLSGGEELIDYVARVVPEAPASQAGDEFGAALTFGALANERSALVVGAPGSQQGGSAYLVLSTESSALGSAADIAPSYRMVSSEGSAERFGASVAVGNLLGPGTLAIGAPDSQVARLERAGRVHLWRAFERDAEEVQVLDGLLEDGGFGSVLLASGRRNLSRELFASSPQDPRGSLRKLVSGFDVETLDFRAEASAGPRTRGTLALVRGDFDGNGTFDLAIGLPTDIDPGARAPAGGAIEVWRRADDGEWSSWGRYHQGE